MLDTLLNAIIEKKIELIQYRNNWSLDIENSGAMFKAWCRTQEELLELNTLYNLHNF